jgi:hypothetical protein
MKKEADTPRQKQEPQQQKAVDQKGADQKAPDKGCPGHERPTVASAPALIS